MLAAPTAEPRLEVKPDKDIQLKDKNSEAPVLSPPSSPSHRVSFCQRFGMFFLNVGSVVGASLGVYNYMNPKP